MKLGRRRARCIAPLKGMLHVHQALSITPPRCDGLTIRCDVHARRNTSVRHLIRPEIVHVTQMLKGYSGANNEQELMSNRFEGKASFFEKKPDDI